MFRIFRAGSVAEAVALVAARRGTVLLDLDGTLVRTDASSAELDALVEQVLAAASVRDRAVVVVTNRRLDAPPGGRIRVLGSAAKPWTRRRLLPGDVAGVVGDQAFTDGLLALRLAVPFAHVDSLDDVRRPGAVVGDVLLGRVLRWIGGGARDHD